ncbi:hypothetical protein BH23VER1_BH23VER1_18880 [soil metagenome]
MARQRPQHPVNKEALIAQIDAQRPAMAHHAAEFSHAVNPKARFSSSVARHPAGWLLGTALTGIAFARLVLGTGRRRRDRKPIIPTSVKSIFTLFVGLLARSVFSHYAPLVEQRLREKIGALVGADHPLMLPAPSSQLASASTPEAAPSIHVHPHRT